MTGTAGADNLSAIERPQTLTATVLSRLKEQIIDGTIPLGSMLSEKQLAEQFRTSKTPVREAFVQLQSMGLLTVLPQRGGMVFQPSITQVRELCETRLVIETSALRFAAERDRHGLIARLDQVVEHMKAVFDVDHSAPYQIDDNEFHLAFVFSCGNTLLYKAYELFLPRIRALRTDLSSPEPYLLEQSFKEHQEMLQAIRGGDIETTVALLTRHIERSRKFYTKRLKQRDSATVLSSKAKQ